MNILEIIIIAVISTLIGIITDILVRKGNEKSINHVHFYAVRDTNGELFLYLGKPIRLRQTFTSGLGVVLASSYEFSKYGLNKNDYANLKWEDEPVEVFLNMED